MIRQQLKSRTNWFALLLVALGPVEANFHLLQDLLGQWYGLAFCAVGAVVAVLRQITTGPVSEK